MKVKRLTFKEGIYDFSSRVYGFDSMFPRTLRDITIRPGVAAEKFIRGNRASYYGPIGYYFLMFAVMLMVAGILGIDFNDAMMNRGREMVDAPSSARMLQASERLNAFVLENFRMFSFALVIFETLWLRVLFRKSGYNLLEHSVMPFYVMGHFHWLTIFDFLFVSITGVNVNQYLIFAIHFLFLGYAAMNLYTHNSRVKAFIKGFLSYGLAMFSFMLLIAAVTIVWILVDPEMREMIKAKNP
jgi:hypothetical protein